MEKIEEMLPGVEKSVSLAPYTTYKIGGPAKYFFCAKTKEKLLRALLVAKKLKIPVFILGGGSNILVSDHGFKGLVIKIDILRVSINGNKADVGASVSITQLANLLAGNKLSGFEWAAGIPGGTVGGAIYGHAQAFGYKMSDCVEAVEAVNLKTLRVKTFTKKQCNFSLKNSIFKKEKKWVIISARTNFVKSDKAKIKNKMREFLGYRKKRHPMNIPSAGSVFVNSERQIKDKELLSEFPEFKKYNKERALHSGYLIEKCGLAGKNIGGAQISKKHANFIVNLGGAKAKDVLALINLARAEVKKKFKVNMELEIQLLGFNGKQK